jgi:hypothetical protein
LITFRLTCHQVYQIKSLYRIVVALLSDLNQTQVSIPSIASIRLVYLFSPVPEPTAPFLSLSIFAFTLVMSSTKDTPPKVSVARDASPASVASDGGEKPVREQLKKTKIDTAKPAAPTSVPTTTSKPASVGRKRSFESVEKESENSESPASRHSRKRSRDVEKDGKEEDSARAATPEAIDTNGQVDAGQVDAEQLLSPKGKRNRATFTKDVNGGVLEEEKSDEEGEAKRDAKRPKDEEEKAENEKKEEKTDTKKVEGAAKV